MHITTRKLTAAAVTGAAYAALTMLLAPISYGAIQCRVSEVLCILPFFIPCTCLLYTSRRSGRSITKATRAR